MVCIYCGSSTKVANSRLQRRANQVWRRRQCLDCRAIFTTQEAPELSLSFVVQYGTHLLPFSKELLFTSVYESCKHRATAITDAAALTQTIISKLLQTHKEEGTIQRHDIIQATRNVLGNFDTTAAAVYAAYHPE